MAHPVRSAICQSGRRVLACGDGAGGRHIEGAHWCLSVDAHQRRLLAILKGAPTLLLGVGPAFLVRVFGLEENSCPAAPTVSPRDLRLLIGDSEVPELVKLLVTAQDLAVWRKDVARLGSVWDLKRHWLAP